MNQNIGVASYGIRTPIIKEGDDLVRIVVDSVLAAMGDSIRDNDIIGITESVVARSAGLYVSVDEIAQDIQKRFGPSPTLVLDRPIYSRNRFSMILKGISRAAGQIVMLMPDFDEVGNPSGLNVFTGVNIKDYYREICDQEDCSLTVNPDGSGEAVPVDGYIYCGLHDYAGYRFRDHYEKLSRQTGRFILHEDTASATLADICSDKNPDFGVLGTNKSSEEKLKLFPTYALADTVCSRVRAEIREKTGHEVFTLIFGDGGFKSPYIGGLAGSSIWEEADPVIWLSSKDQAEIFNGKPNEIKIKNFADDKYGSLRGAQLNEAIKEEIRSSGNSLVGKMASQGTTPRRIGDLVGSQFDLLVGSGSKGCPVCVLSGYFDNYSKF